MTFSLELSLKAVFMIVSGQHLNRFERTLFRAALVLAGLILMVRVGAIVVMFCLHHVR